MLVRRESREDCNQTASSKGLMRLALLQKQSDLGLHCLDSLGRQLVFQFF